MWLWCRCGDECRHNPVLPTTTTRRLSITQAELLEEAITEDQPRQRSRDAAQGGLFGDDDATTQPDSEAEPAPDESDSERDGEAVRAAESEVSGRGGSRITNASGILGRESTPDQPSAVGGEFDVGGSGESEAANAGVDTETEPESSDADTVRTDDAESGEQGGDRGDTSEPRPGGDDAGDANGVDRDADDTGTDRLLGAGDDTGVPSDRRRLSPIKRNNCRAEQQPGRC